MHQRFWSRLLPRVFLLAAIARTSSSMGLLHCSTWRVQACPQTSRHGAPLSLESAAVIARKRILLQSRAPCCARKRIFQEDKYPQQLTLTFTQLSPFSFDCPLIARAARSRCSSWVEGGCSGGRQRDGGKQKPEMCSGTGVRDHGPRRGVHFGE